MARTTRPAAAVIRRSRAVSDSDERQQLVVAVQQVADAADADRHAAADQLGVDLRDAAVLGVAEPADQGDDVEAELVLRQGEAPLLLGAEAGLVAGAVGVAAAADLEAQADQPLQGDDGALGRGGRPERPGAGGAGPCLGGQFQGPIGPGAGHSVAAWGGLLEAASAQGVTIHRPSINEILLP